MTRSRDRHIRQKRRDRRLIREQVLPKFIAPLGLMLIYLWLSITFALLGTPIFDTFGDGFFLQDDKVTTGVVIRNDSPVSFPGIYLSYSYGARVLHGNAACELDTVEGTEPCGSMLVGIGTIKQGESKVGYVEIFPNHGNFTVMFTAHVLVFCYSAPVADVVVSCSTRNGTDYTCVRPGGQKGAPPPARTSLIEAVELVLNTLDSGELWSADPSAVPRLLSAPRNLTPLVIQDIFS
jgi:hypothetical protein